MLIKLAIGIMVCIGIIGCMVSVVSYAKRKAEEAKFIARINEYLNKSMEAQQAQQAQ